MMLNMSMINRLQQKDQEIVKGLAYAEANLGMKGLHMSEHADKLIWQYGHGEITEKELFQVLGNE